MKKDYTDFFSFNFPDDNMPCPESVPRPPLDVGEATKLLMMKIHVNKIVYPEPGTGYPEIKGKIWPIVHWRGNARSFDGSPGEGRLTWGLRGEFPTIDHPDLLYKDVDEWHIDKGKS